MHRSAVLPGEVDAHIAKTMEKIPELVQISSAWNTREGAPLGRNRYEELQIKKAKANGSAAKQPAIQKPCEKMTDPIVMDGGNRGQTVQVCADPNCRVHHGDKPSPQQLQRDRALERKRIEKEKIAITARQRILAAILERVSVPLKSICLRLHSAFSGVWATTGFRCWQSATSWKSKKRVHLLWSFCKSRSLVMTRVDCVVCCWKSACSSRHITTAWTPTTMYC
jgi:hypothetical protein